MGDYREQSQAARSQESPFQRYSHEYSTSAFCRQAGSFGEIASRDRATVGATGASSAGATDRFRPSGGATSPWASQGGPASFGNLGAPGRLESRAPLLLEVRRADAAPGFAGNRRDHHGRRGELSSSALAL